MEMQVKEKIGKSIEEKQQEMIKKTKARTIIEDKWERKKYLKECDNESIKDVIRLHMWQMSSTTKGIILTPNAHYVKNRIHHRVCAEM